MMKPVKIVEKTQLFGILLIPNSDKKIPENHEISIKKT